MHIHRLAACTHNTNTPRCAYTYIQPAEWAGTKQRNRKWKWKSEEVDVLGDRI
jgi:hypothetical protein